jgi:hypothetical protein
VSVSVARSAIDEETNGNAGRKSKQVRKPDGVGTDQLEALAIYAGSLWDIFWKPVAAVEKDTPNFHSRPLREIIPALMREIQDKFVNVPKVTPTCFEGADNEVLRDWRVKYLANLERQLPSLFPEGHAKLRPIGIDTNVLWDILVYADLYHGSLTQFGQEGAGFHFARYFDINVVERRHTSFHNQVITNGEVAYVLVKRIFGTAGGDGAAAGATGGAPAAAGAAA